MNTEYVMYNAFYEYKDMEGNYYNISMLYKTTFSAPQLHCMLTTVCRTEGFPFFLSPYLLSHITAL